MATPNAIITGSGSAIPEKTITNASFMNHEFLNEDGSDFASDNATIIRKFKAITGIEERRYMTDDQVTSDLGTIAARRAIDDAGIDQEKIDCIIVAHNYGDVQPGKYSDMVPSLATRIKHQLGIKSPHCVGYDILFGCPGWVLGLTQAYAYIKAGMANNCLVIGAEGLSRVVDDHDRDSMIYSDGAGAVVVQKSDTKKGILGHATATYTEDEAYFIFNDETYKKDIDSKQKYIKMFGRRIYNFALSKVPLGMKAALEHANVDISDVKKIFIHQANEKMDEAIVKRFYELYDMPEPDDIMPMIIQKYGNSSVATVPTVFDLCRKGLLGNHEVNEGDIVLFASVGAGMNINAVVYQM